MSRDKTEGGQKAIDSLGTSNFALCYQCAKCSTGCPIVEAMDYLPHQILKMVQLGLMEDVLGSSVIWLCAGCQTCAVRCPMEIDLPQVMDSLREQAIVQGVPAAERRIALFCNGFLADIQQRGRVHELRQLLAYKLKARDLVSDIGLGVRMLTRRRLALKSDRVDRADQVQAIFDKFKVSKVGGA